MRRRYIALLVVAGGVLTPARAIMPRFDEVRLEVRVFSNVPVDAAYAGSIADAIREKVAASPARITFMDDCDLVLEITVSEQHVVRGRVIAVHLAAVLFRHGEDDTGSFRRVYWRDQRHGGIERKQYARFLDQGLQKIVDAFAKEWLIENRRKEWIPGTRRQYPTSGTPENH